MPGAAVGISRPGQHMGKGQVSIPPLAKRRRADHRRTDQRMPEADAAGPDSDELRPLQLAQPVRHAELPRRRTHIVPAGVLRARGHQEQLLGVR